MTVVSREQLSRPRSGLFLTVHYGEVRFTCRLLESLAKLSRIDQLDVVIVNNDPHQEAEKYLYPWRDSLPSCMVMTADSNLGYFGGAKAGIDYYVQRCGSLPNWIVIANNDVIVEDPSFLEKLFICDPQKVGMLAPSIMSTRTGSDQNPFLRRRPGRARMLELRLWLSNYYMARFHEQLSYCKYAIRGWLGSFGRKKSNDRAWAGERIYSPHGAFLIFSRTFFELGGYLDDAQFLYTEEITLGEMCRSLKLPIVYDPHLVAVHDEHRATGRRYSRATYRHQKNAIGYLGAKYLSDVL